MKRHISLEEFTDGKLYTCNDLVRLACDDCSGCSACCRNMEALVLDPYDVDQLRKGLDTDFLTLMQEAISITPVDGLLLPVMNTKGEKDQCSFLNEEGRCKIHNFRPGICRLFPLGRYYHNGSFSYVLQLKECHKVAKSKVKIKKWLGIPDLKAYDQFILTWHDFLARIQEESRGLNPEQVKILHLYLLKSFYEKGYGQAFYEEFKERYLKACSDLGLE